MRKVLIVSHLFEPSVNRVIEHLDQLGVSWARINIEEFPLLLNGNIKLSSEQSEFSIQSLKGPLRADDIGSIWFRRTSQPALPLNLSQRDRTFVRNEVAAFHNGWLGMLDALWVNDRDAERAASNKPYQLRLASRIGFDIPATLITNDPQDVRDAAKQLGTLIFKPLSGFAPRGADYTDLVSERFKDWGNVECETFDTPEAEVVFTQLLDEEKMSKIDKIKLSPAIFQKFINKTSDIRVTVVGDYIHACRIMSQERAETRVDFRRMAFMDGAPLSHSEIELPNTFRAMVGALMSRLGLIFGCLDFVEGDDGRMYFLEVNPSGQWLWIEQLVGAPISAALADCLARPCAR